MTHGLRRCTDGDQVWLPVLRVTELSLDFWCLPGLGLAVTLLLVYHAGKGEKGTVLPRLRASECSSAIVVLENKTSQMVRAHVSNLTIRRFCS